MIFEETKLDGAFVITPELVEDERGFFARTWCEQEFKYHGLNPAVVQCSVSFSTRRGTLRGLHFQVAPHAEAKLVRCTMGGIYDVIIDLRPDSPTYKQWTAIELTMDNRRLLYAPEGFAHGFQTLRHNTEVFYQISTPYALEAAGGVRWDDPTFGVQWPEPVTVISERDAAYPDFEV